MPFKKGQTGNPGGRPKAIGGVTMREEILRQTNNGAELVSIMLGIARGEREDAKASDVIAALKWLSDYGVGKPTEHIEHSGMVTIEALVAGASKLNADGT